MIKIKKVFTNNYITNTKIPDSDYVINPYIGCPHKCLYCYAEFMKKFTNHVEPWGDFLDVKMSFNPLNVKKLIGKKVLIGSVTDAYNKYESQYLVTRKILEALVGVDTEISILTKSNLVIRDIDLFEKMKNITIVFSINTIDDTFRKHMEPYASSIDKRIQALKTLSKYKIKTSVFLSPIFPKITNFRAIIDFLKDYSQEFWFENLKLYPYCINRILKYIDIKYSHLSNLYHEIYTAKETTYWQHLQKEIINYCKKNSVTYCIYFYHNKIKKKLNIKQNKLKSTTQLNLF